MPADDPYALTWDPGPQFEIRDEDTVALAGLLGVPARSLLLAAGGPWSAGWERPDALVGKFAGRAGMSVALIVRSFERTVDVGPTAWTRQFPHPVWDLGEPHVSLALPGSAVHSQQEFLEQLAVAVDDAAKRKPRSRVVCRVCGSITPKAYMFGDGMCDGCASSLLGVVF